MNNEPMALDHVNPKLKPKQLTPINRHCSLEYMMTVEADGFLRNNWWQLTIDDFEKLQTCPLGSAHLWVLSENSSNLCPLYVPEDPDDSMNYYRMEYEVALYDAEVSLKFLNFDVEAIDRHYKFYIVVSEPKKQISPLTFVEAIQLYNLHYHTTER